MGSAAARPTLTPGMVYGGPQVRDHMPIVSVNPEARYDEAGSQARKNPRSRKRAWNNQKEVLAKKQGPREASPQAPRIGIQPPEPQQWESTPQTQGMFFCGWKPFPGGYGLPRQVLGLWCGL